MHFGNHHIELSKSLHDKMSKIYIFQAIMIFVKGLIGVFVPVYLYKLGYSVIEVIIYTNLILLTYLLFIPFSIKLIKKFGFKYVLLLSIPVYILHITTLNFLNKGIIFYHLAWFSFGIYMAIFWLAMHSEIALNGSSAHRSSQIGTLQIITTIFATLAPIFGGFFLQYLGYLKLLIFSTIFLIGALLPLLFSKDLTLKKYDFNYRDYVRLLSSKKNEGSKKAFLAEGVEILLSLNIWPIVLFILLNENFLNLGLLYSFISFLSVIFIMYIKNYLDKKDKHELLVASTKFMSVSWFLRAIIIFLSSIFLYFIETFSKLVYNVYSLSYTSIFYNNAKNTEFMDYIILRELYIFIGKAIVSILFIIIIYFFGSSIRILLTLCLIGIILPIGLNFLREEKSEDLSNC